MAGKNCLDSGKSINIPSLWNPPKFGFGDRVKWKGEEGRLGWYGCIVGLMADQNFYPNEWIYTVWISEDSPLRFRLKPSPDYDQASEESLEPWNP